MKSEMKAKWIEALKSGEYKKTAGCLRDEDGFCCLGVLLDINGEMWVRSDEARLLMAWRPVSQDLHHRGSLDLSNLRKFGLSEKEQDCLTAVNDKSETFEPVIEQIEILIKGD